MRNGLRSVLIDPDESWQNGADESFNGQFSDEYLVMKELCIRAEAKMVSKIWQQRYKDVRPHSSLGKQEQD